MRKYNKGAVEAQPCVSGHFWPSHIHETGGSLAPMSPTPSSSSREDSIWTHVEDLSAHESGGVVLGCC